MSLQGGTRRLPADDAVLGSPGPKRPKPFGVAIEYQSKFTNCRVLRWTNWYATERAQESALIAAKRKWGYAEKVRAAR